MLLNIRKFLESRNVPSEVITMIESVPSSDLKKLDEHWIDLLGGEDAFLSEMTHARCKQFDGGKVAEKNRAVNKERKIFEEVKRYGHNFTLEVLARHRAAINEVGRRYEALKSYNRCKYFSELDILHDIQY